MKDYSPRRGIQGFTLVETVLAIGLLSFAAVMSSRTLLDSTRSIHRLRFQKKASSLVEMVYQQYTAYAANNYQLLSTYDATNQQPKDFFNRPDNFGYDGILITTLATYSANKSSCTVAVTLTWQDGGTPKTSAYVKTFVQTSQLGNGAVVQVWLKSPCAGGTDQASIIANCPGVVGVVVSAPANNAGTTVVGTTDTNGQVLLKQVLPGSGVLMQITAPALADYTNATAAPSYYARDAGGNYVSTLSKSVSFTSANLNTLVVTDFKPTGQITGQLANDDTLIANPPVDNMYVMLATGSIVALNGSFATCSTTVPCFVTSDTNGKFVFNNVVPIPMAIAVAGRPGSALTVQQSDPSFQWGYTSKVPVPIAATDWNGALSHSPVTQGPILSEPVHMSRLGWAVVQVTNQFTGAPIANMTLTAWISPLAVVNQAVFFGNAGTSDSNGQVAIYNIFGIDTHLQISINGGRLAQGGDYGYYGKQDLLNLSHCLGHATTIPYTMIPGYQLTGQLVDDNPSSGLAGLQVTQGIPIDPWELTANVDPTGHFALQGFIPASDATIPIVTTLPLQNGSKIVTDTLVGSTIDQLTGQPAPHTMLELNSFQYGAYFKSDVSGNFNITSTFTYQGVASVSVACDNTTLQCVICPVGGPCSVATGGAVVHIDTRQNTITFRFDGTMHGFTYDQFDENVVAGTPTAPIVIPCRLHDYAVSGMTQDTAAQPLAGISVLDGDGNAIGTSADGTAGTTKGAYQGWAVVDGRTLLTPGTVSFSVTAQGARSGTTAGPVSLPSPLDPLTPILQDLQLSGSGSGSSGGI